MARRRDPTQTSARDPLSGRLTEAHLGRLLDRFARVRLLVLGDAILDEYLWGEVDRVSPEAPVPVVRVGGESVVLGGAGNVARNVAALGGQAAFVSVVGGDADGRHVVDLCKELGIDARGVVVDERRPTTRKTRVVARGQQIVRFDRETTRSLSSPVTSRLWVAMQQVVDGCHGAILEDYGKGVLAPRLARRIVAELRSRDLFVAVDPKGELSPYRGASLVKPNWREAEAVAGRTARDREQLSDIGPRLARALDGADLVVTGGGAGMTLFAGDGGFRAVPTVRQDVYDMQGAGDTTIATLALALRSGATLLEAAVLANAAAGVVVQKSGTATALPEEVRALLPEVIRAARDAAAVRSDGAPRGGRR